MWRSILMTSAMTGMFCAGFAAIVDAVTDQLSMVQVIIAGAISGASGSFIAQLVTRDRVE